MHRYHRILITVVGVCMLGTSAIISAATIHSTFLPIALRSKGAQLTTLTPSSSQTPTKTPTPSRTPAPSWTPTQMATEMPSVTTTSVSITNTPTPSNTPTITNTPRPTETTLPTETSTPTATGTSPPCDTIGGIIDQSRVLISGCIYHVLSNTLVAEGAILTIPQETTLRFGYNTYMQVDGALLIEGTNANPVLFTTYDGSYWRGLRVSAKSGSSSSLKHLILEYAVGRQDDQFWALHIEGAQPAMENITLRYNSFPLYLSAGAGKSVKLKNSVIHDNNNYSFLIYGTNIIENTTITDNGGPRMLIACGGSQILNNKIIDNTAIGVSIGSCGWGEPIIVQGNTIQNNYGGIAADTGPKWSASVISNDISDNGPVIGGGLGFPYAAITIGCGIDMTSNNIVGNDTDVAVRIITKADCDVNGTDNWWGTDQIASVTALVYDYYDDFQLGKLLYQPIAKSPYTISFSGAK